MQSSAVMCPYLKGGDDGALCSIINNLVKDMEGFTIKLCMSRRYEACSAYITTLLNMVQEGR